MIVTHLKLLNVRAIEIAEFSFKPGLNLIVGVNGAGKTTALDALAVCLGGVTRQVNALRGGLKRFGADDVNVSADSLTAEIDVEIDEAPYAYVCRQPREPVVAQTGKRGMPREQTRDNSPFYGFADNSPPVAGQAAGQHPLAVLFSTRRSVPDTHAPSRAALAGGYRAAFADALAHRELLLGDFAAWLRAQVALSREATVPASRIIESLNRAVERFLPGYSNVHVTDEPRSRIFIDKDGVQIPVAQLSDGERGILALVFDLTRRLAQANPGVPDPGATGRGVVLIDELDLHLHPTWQREIVNRLPGTFPNLQFIATTHSPQVIGEVHSDHVQILDHGEVVSPGRSFGKDANQVLEEIMGTPSRAEVVQAQLSELSAYIADGNLEAANAALDRLSSVLGSSDPEVLRTRTLLEFLADDE